MKILITNDDSISASQLMPLAKHCRKYGDVTVVVPKFEQSGKSQGIELHKPFEIKRLDDDDGIAVYTVDSTPADCVRYAVLGMKQEFDLVISGINRGFNMGADIMYSGTAGAAFEAVSLGLSAIALSTSPENYEDVTGSLDMVFDFVWQNKLMQLHNLYNINIPPMPKGFRVTRQGGHYYSDDFVPVGNDLYMPKGKCVYQNRHDLTIDSDAVAAGYISVMPMTINRAQMQLFDDLQKLNS